MKLPTTGEFVRHHGTLLKIEDIPPPPPSLPEKDFIFVEQEARCEMQLNSELIKEIRTLNDFYGIGTGVKTAIKEMIEYADSINISKDSDLEIVVIKVETQYRARPIDKENFYDKQYFDFKRNDYGGSKGLPDPVETKVWSSKGL